MFRRKNSGLSKTVHGSVVSVSGKNKQRGAMIKEKHLRSVSMPTMGSDRLKGIMKYLTIDDSLRSCSTTNLDRDSSHSDPTSKRACRRARSLQFTDIRIREYSRTVGDNPSCSSGPPITISWEYNPNTKIITLDQYEKCRPPRRTHLQMILPREVRQRMLRHEWDVTQSQIAAAVRANIKVKNQRRMTVNNLGKATRMEEMMESASRRMIRGLRGQKSTSEQVEALKEAHERATRATKQAKVDQITAEEYASIAARVAVVAIESDTDSEEKNAESSERDEDNGSQSSTSQGPSNETTPAATRAGGGPPAKSTPRTAADAAPVAPCRSISPPRSTKAREVAEEAPLTATTVNEDDDSMMSEDEMEC